MQDIAGAMLRLAQDAREGRGFEPDALSRLAHRLLELQMRENVIAEAAKGAPPAALNIVEFRPR